jgi:hypothetical protein
MKTKFNYLSILIMIILAVTLFAPESALAATTITVKPTDVGVSWFTALPFADTRTGGSVSFVMGPATAPSGMGSLQMTSTDANGSSQAKAQAVTGAYVGIPLNTITALSYYAYRDSTSTNSTAQTISLNIAVDYVGDGSSFTTLVFEPVYQAGGVGAMQLDSWQLWDAFNGGNGIWWSTKAIPGVPQAFTSYVTWNTIVTNNPNAKVVGIFGFNIGSGWAGQFKGAADALTVGISGTDTIYDFEPEPPCTIVCYVDAVNGDDSNGGASAGDAKKTIQAAIDAVSASGTVRVLPGNYDETATNRFVLGNGPHQFGLFIDKDGITVQGVDASDIPIMDYNALEAYITTNATNNFGASGIFVQADDVTLAGLHIGHNIPGDNKTIEIIGDGFTLKDSHVDVPGGGSVYFNDWQYDTGTNTSHVQSYTIDHNLIDQSTSIDLTSGAGYSGPVSGRQIINNEFENSQFWPSISFNGSGTGVPWFVQSVGGAVIENNSFTNTFNGTDVTAAHIRVRGTVNNSQFDWTSYWNDNTFNKAVVTLVGTYPPFDVRQYNYTSGPYSFDTRRIGVNIQSGVDKAQAGDTVLVKDGAYPESPNINKSLTLKSWAGRDLTTIQLQPGPTYLGALTIDGADVTVDGFTILGFDGTPSTLASSNLYVTGTPDTVTITNNRIKVGAIDTTSSNGDDGFGLLTTYNTSSDVENVTMTGNIIEPANAEGGRAFYVNPGVKDFTFTNNEITGKFARTAITQAKNGIVEANTLMGVGPAGSRSAGFGTWGYPDPMIYGHTTFRDNTISGVGKGIAIFETNDVIVENNFFLDNGVAVWIGEAVPLTFDLSTIHVEKNSIVNSDTFGIQNALSSGPVDGELNWWDSSTGPSGVGPGSGDSVSNDVDFTPWLCDGTDTSVAIGFQPNVTTLCSIATKLVFSTQPGDGVAGSPLSTQPVVQAVDDDGNVDPNFNGAVTLTINNNPGGGTLGGTTTVNAVNGVATFTDISVSQPGVGYTLDASGGALTSATSDPFNVTAAGPAPAACLVYGVQDTGSIDTQFFTLDPVTKVTANLGPLYQGWDFETLDIDPTTGIIYAATSGGNAFNQKGHLFVVDGLDGSLFPVGPTGQKKLEALAFRPTDGTLWGWVSGKGLVTVNKSTGAATIVKADKRSVEGLAWDNSGTMLYFAKGKNLFSYNPANGKITSIAKNMPGPVEALDMRPDGLLAVGVDGKSTLYAYNPLTKQFVSSQNITGLPYKDIEGISWPECGE